MHTEIIDNREEINKIISLSRICSISIIDENGLPYVVPMNFGYEGGDVIYLHSGREGSVVRSLQKNPNICINFCSDSELIYQSADVACSYRMRAASVIIRGKLEFEEDYKEKVKALNIIMKQYTDRAFTYSEPAVNHTLVWKVKIDHLSALQFGLPYVKTARSKDNPFF